MGGRGAGQGDGQTEIRRCRYIQRTTHPKSEVRGEGGWRQTSMFEDNRREVINLVEGGPEKVSFPGCFERGCRLDVMDLRIRRKQAPLALQWARKRKGPLTEEFVFV